MRITRVGRWANVAKLDVVPSVMTAIRRMARWRPDIWHLHTPNVTMMLASLAAPGVRPLVITHHSDIVRQRLLKYAVKPIESAVYRRATQVLPTSAAYAEGSDTLGSFAEKLAPLPLGIDLTPFQNPTAEALAHAEHWRGTAWFSTVALCWAVDLLQGFAHRPGSAAIGSGEVAHHWHRPARTRTASKSERTRCRGSCELPRPRDQRATRGRVPRGNRVVVPKCRPERRIWVGPGGSDGERMPGDQHRHSRQWRAVGQSARA